MHRLMCMQHREREGMTHRTKDLFQCFLGSKWSISLYNGYKFALNPQVPDSQGNTVCVKWGAGKESNPFYHSELVCYLPVPNIPAGKPQEKGALCCIYSGWAFSPISPSGSSTGNIQVRMREAEEPVQQHAQELWSSLCLLLSTAGHTLFVLECAGALPGCSERLQPLNCEDLSAAPL